MFEGSEKKIEFIFSKDSPSLLEQPFNFWKKIVKSCGAEIIAHSKFPQIHSYILSESSLFIWDHRLVLITCGKTTLSKSLIKILKNFSEENIEVCFFQRKNEFFPAIQKSCFLKDYQKIKRKIKGKAYRFGSLNDHHFFLFHSETDFLPDKDDQTLEILVYDSDTIKDTSKESMMQLKKKLGNTFVGFEIQEHFFKPLGYSLNAVRDDKYYTLHITPEQSFFYISFETNIETQSIKTSVDQILNLFQPRRFDLILFEPIGKQKKMLKLDDYVLTNSFYQVLDCGYSVSYKNFHKNKLATQQAFLINS